VAYISLSHVEMLWIDLYQVESCGNAVDWLI
jgi:hypothetical protein